MVDRKLFTATAQHKRVSLGILLALGVEGREESKFIAVSSEFIWLLHHHMQGKNA